MRVLHGPVNVGNQPWMLSRMERSLGLDSDLVVNFNTWLQYPNDRCLSEYGKPTLKSVSDRLLFSLAAPFRYDVLHYYFGKTFLSWYDYGSRYARWFADLKLAKMLGRRIIFTLQGCDVRLSDLSDETNEITFCREGFCQSVAACRTALDRERRYFIDNIAPLADRCFVLNPELLRCLPGSTFLPYTSVDVENISPVPPRTDGRITILHAPSDPSVKGTDHIVKAIDVLKEKYPIDLVMVKGLPHEQAVKLYRQADIVIDQLLAGWYGAFAVEVMAMGKPVMCYMRHEDFGPLPRQLVNDIPILDLNIHRLVADIETVIRQRTLWPEWGRKSRDYVLRWHNPKSIAEAMVKIYQNPAAEFIL